MKIVQVAILVMALAMPVFADNIPNGVTATDNTQNSVAVVEETPNDSTPADNIPNGVDLLTLLMLILR